MNISFQHTTKGESWSTTFGTQCHTESDQSPSLEQKHKCQFQEGHLVRIKTFLHCAINHSASLSRYHATTAHTLAQHNYLEHLERSYCIRNLWLLILANTQLHRCLDANPVVGWAHQTSYCWWQSQWWLSWWWSRIPIQKSTTICYRLLINLNHHLNHPLYILNMCMTIVARFIRFRTYGVADMNKIDW